MMRLRLHLLGLAAMGSGSDWSGRSGAGISGLERVEGGVTGENCGEASRDLDRLETKIWRFMESAVGTVSAIGSATLRRDVPLNHNCPL